MRALLFMLHATVYHAEDSRWCDCKRTV